MVVTTKTDVFGHEMGWEGATEEDVRNYILNRMNVNLKPVFACSNSEDEEFCNSGVFLSLDEELEESVLSSGWVEIDDIIERPDSEYPEEAFEAMLRYALDWSVEVKADSQETANRLVEQNLARCFQLEEMGTSGYFEITVIQLENGELDQQSTNLREKKVNTSIENRTAILADLFQNYRGHDEFTDFVSFNDIGLPVSYAISNKIVIRTDASDRFVNETFELLVAALGIEDSGFENLEGMFLAAE